MYPSDLSDQEWELIAHHFEPKDRRGSGHIHSKKRVVDAILYVVKGGIGWRMLPHDFPPWKTVYDHFRNWNQRGVWEAALDELNALHRKKKGRKEGPSYGIVDSQSVKLSMLVKRGALMVTRRGRGASGISSSIFWVIY